MTEHEFIQGLCRDCARIWEGTEAGGEVSFCLECTPYAEAAMDQMEAASKGRPSLESMRRQMNEDMAASDSLVVNESTVIRYISKCVEDEGLQYSYFASVIGLMRLGKLDCNEALVMCASMRNIGVAQRAHNIRAANELRAQNRWRRRLQRLVDRVVSAISQRRKRTAE